MGVGRLAVSPAESVCLSSWVKPLELGQVSKRELAWQPDWDLVAGFSSVQLRTDCCIAEVWSWRGDPVWGDETAVNAASSRRNEEV